jgi:phosphoribosylamine--glycine ligase
VFVAPGNPGCEEVGTCIPAGTGSPSDLLQIANNIRPDLTVVGPEAPLVDGVVDLFEKNGFLCFGPTAAAARLEGSKIFAKNFMQAAGIPTARFESFEQLDAAVDALDRFTLPIVIKADGLAAGKGVVICATRTEAEQTLQAMFGGALAGEAGRKVVLEEFLTGEEVSFIGISDGEHVEPWEPSQDHKTIHENDQGPNTGGMGAYSDSRLLNAEQRAFVMDCVMRPVIRGMAEAGTPFRGFLYAGLMMTERGPMVLEFNVRLGDPEAQALLHRFEADLGILLLQAARGALRPDLLHFRRDPSITVVLAAAGYPGKVRTGDVITGLEAARSAGATVFHGGTARSGDALVTKGGRVLSVTASGPTLAGAIQQAYAACSHISFEGMQMRRDIGKKGLARW